MSFPSRRMPFPVDTVGRPLCKNRWDVDGHLQGYGRSIGVLFNDLGKYNVSISA